MNHQHSKQVLNNLLGQTNHCLLHRHHAHWEQIILLARTASPGPEWPPYSLAEQATGLPDLSHLPFEGQRSFSPPNGHSSMGSGAIY